MLNKLNIPNYLLFSLLTGLLTLVLVGESFAQKRILILSWNVESSKNNPNIISEELEKFEGYDIIGLTEVNANNASKYVRAVAVGEGAKNSANPIFNFRIGTTGGSDRMMIIWDAKRFDLIGETQEIHELSEGNHRAPFLGRFKLKNTDIEFIFMVNHLARVNSELRQRQATGLSEWVTQQTLPVIAIGDYNFDYDIDDGEGNIAMNNMLSSGAFKWVRPPELFQTQESPRFFSVLDFIFIAHKPSNWAVSSKILNVVFPFPADPDNSDHRPVQARILISPE